MCSFLQVSHISVSHIYFSLTYIYLITIFDSAVNYKNLFPCIKGERLIIRNLKIRKDNNKRICSYKPTAFHLLPALSILS